jgi:hypothetical protein
LRRQRLLLGLVAAIGTTIAVVTISAVARDAPSAPPGSGGRPDPAIPRTGSTAIKPQGDLEIRPPDEYRIVYRVDDYAGGTAVTTTEDLRVRRPFDSVLERKTGSPPGKETTSRQLTRFGRLAIPAQGEGAMALDVPPDLAGGDFRFDVALTELVGEGVIDMREWRRVGARACRVHRAAEPITGTAVTAWDGDRADYADLCIDRRGLLLEELWVTDGKVLRRRLAVEVDDERAALGDTDLVDPSTPLSPHQGGGSLVEVEASSSPLGPSWELPKPPQGFQLKGRYSVTPPRRGAEPVGNDDRARLVDVWINGRDVLLLEQGALEQVTPGGDRSIGELQATTTSIGVRMNEIGGAAVDGAPQVRVRGTISIDKLLQAARNVRRLPEGTGLRPRSS